MQFVNKFRTDPTGSGINYEKLSSMQRSRFALSVLMTLIGVLSLNPKLVMFIYCSGLITMTKLMNGQKTGSVTLIHRSEYYRSYQVSEETLIQANTEKKSSAIFEKLRDRELLRLGVPEKQIAVVRSIFSADLIKPF